MISGSPGPVITFQPNIAGDFVLAVYSGTRLLRTVQIAIVQATLQLSSSAFQPHDNLAAFGQSGVQTQGQSYNAMDSVAEYLLEGGGQDENVGVNGVTLGDVGNLVKTTVTIAYPIPTPPPPAPGNESGTGTEISGNCAIPPQTLSVCRTPMVDTSRVEQGQTPTGDISAFRVFDQLSADLRCPEPSTMVD
jgi:hypothetical protein